MTSECGSRTGNMRSSTASTKLKMAALAPMAKASVKTIVAVRPGLRFSRRAPYRTSCDNVCQK